MYKNGYAFPQIAYPKFIISNLIHFKNQIIDSSIFDVLPIIRIAQALLVVAVNTTATTAVQKAVGMAPKLLILAEKWKAKTIYAIIITAVKNHNIVMETAVVPKATSVMEMAAGRSTAVVKICMDMVIRTGLVRMVILVWIYATRMIMKDPGKKSV